MALVFGGAAGFFFARTGLTCADMRAIEISGVAVTLISCRTDIVAIRTAAPAVETIILGRVIAPRLITPGVTTSVANPLLFGLRL